MEKIVEDLRGRRVTDGAERRKQAGYPVNRKVMCRTFKMLGWSEPARTKREIIRANKKPLHPKAPNQFWESDMPYVWCDMDGGSYCFNVIAVH